MATAVARTPIRPPTTTSVTEMRPSDPRLPPLATVPAWSGRPSSADRSGAGVAATRTERVVEVGRPPRLVARSSTRHPDLTSVPAIVTRAPGAGRGSAARKRTTIAPVASWIVPRRADHRCPGDAVTTARTRTCFPSGDATAAAIVTAGSGEADDVGDGDGAGDGGRSTDGGGVAEARRMRCRDGGRGFGGGGRGRARFGEDREPVRWSRGPEGGPAGAVAAADRTGRDDITALRGGNSPECLRADDDADRPRSVVDAEPEAVGKARRRFHDTAGDADAQPFERGTPRSCQSGPASTRRRRANRDGGRPARSGGRRALTRTMVPAGQPPTRLTSR
jgi:hypothetical protein